MIDNDLPSRMYKTENNLWPDVYKYEEFPPKLKTILLQKLEKVFYTDLIDSKKIEKSAKLAYDSIHEEHSIINEKMFETRGFPKALLSFFKDSLEKKDILVSLDILQVLCKLVYEMAKINKKEKKQILDEINQSIQESNNCNYNQEDQDEIIDSTSKEEKREILDEINQRMLEHGFGYRFDYPHIIRISSEHVHKEIVKPALMLLTDKRFESALESLHKHEELLHKFKPDMKAICKLNNYKPLTTSAIGSLHKHEELLHKFKPYMKAICKLNNYKPLTTSAIGSLHKYEELLHKFKPDMKAICKLNNYKPPTTSAIGSLHKYEELLHKFKPDMKAICKLNNYKPPTTSAIGSLHKYEELLHKFKPDMKAICKLEAKS